MKKKMKINIHRCGFILLSFLIIKNSFAINGYKKKQLDVRLCLKFNDNLPSFSFLQWMNNYTYSSCSFFIFFSSIVGLNSMVEVDLKMPRQYLNSYCQRNEIEGLNNISFDSFDDRSNLNIR